MANNANQWNFDTYNGPAPVTPKRPYPQYQHPANYATLEPYRPPLQPMQTLYANPLYQMLPMPLQSTHNRAAPVKGNNVRSAGDTITGACGGEKAGKEVKRGAAKKTKKSGTRSRSGALNRQNAGASDEEIEELSQKNADAASIKFKNEKWTDAKKLMVLNYITSEGVWKDWKVNQAKEFLNVSSLVVSEVVDSPGYSADIPEASEGEAQC